MLGALLGACKFATIFVAPKNADDDCSWTWWQFYVFDMAILFALLYYANVNAHKAAATIRHEQMRATAQALGRVGLMMRQGSGILREHSTSDPDGRALLKQSYQMMVVAGVWEFIMAALCFVGPFACAVAADPSYGIIAFGLGCYLLYKAQDLKPPAFGREAEQDHTPYLRITA
mmetsp:Transcript_72770/g.115149  ORF Transcript_72770/g.115149 Transcript_72770/m.115149 type:complete len:174 (-) Transcript_72770:18-539(-)